MIRAGLIGLAYDLRGVVSSLNTKHAYRLLLDWLYPTGLNLLTRGLELIARPLPETSNSGMGDRLVHLDIGMATALLKLLREVAQNREGRANFDARVPTGYLLLNEVSQTLVNFG
ncbi:unnamed protein product [Protopolystoma xenopodis]|uniref:Uncharacterized protein n=1 Tax=Protopolystoma xenopodis TaxID=117903 RepID=A0A448WXD7_9PLAT|nr:unnamed protein product [Protopolystoma xenopodis]